MSVYEGRQQHPSTIQKTTPGVEREIPGTLICTIQCRLLFQRTFTPGSAPFIVKHPSFSPPITVADLSSDLEGVDHTFCGPIARDARIIVSWGRGGWFVDNAPTFCEIFVDDYYRFTRALRARFVCAQIVCSITLIPSVGNTLFLLANEDITVKL